ncbi:MAG: sensor histidine kinase [Desulfobacterales bacterium]
MKQTSWLFHPVAVFVISTLSLVGSLFLYIYWYIEVSEGLKAVVRRFDLDASQVLEPQTWLVVLVLSVLVALILLGILIIFAYSQKVFKLYRHQQDFINSFTHELKTPVTSLKLFLETFEKYELPREEREKYVRFMLADVAQLSDTISRILDLARLESRSYQPEFEESDLVEAVESCLSQNSAVLQHADIRVHRPAEVPPVYPLDRVLFHMLVMNLVTNAIKYNVSERPSVDIRFEQTRRHHLIHFEDNGVGLEKRELRKVFRKFYKAASTERLSAKGTGLGLNLVQNIARIHRGRVTAVNRKSGSGSVFTLTLPIRAL